MAHTDNALLAELLKESMSKGIHPKLTINSNSMTPLLWCGDEILLEPITIDQIESGDLLTLTTESDLLTHRYWRRLVQEGQEFLITRGDRPLLFDAPVRPEQIIGRVCVRLRNGRQLHLCHGRGNWLNRQLAHLARAESRWVNSHNHFSWRTKIIRKGVWWWAKILIQLVR
jgi:signal peptidase I